MKRLYKYQFIGAVLWLSSCVSLKTVNIFSTATIGSLKQNTALPVTFSAIYQQRIQDDSLDQHPFNRIPLIGIDFANQVRHDSLRSYQLADSLTGAGSKLLIDYFQALANLSKLDSTFMPVRLKSPTFDNFLQTSAVKLTPDQTASFNRIANLVGSMATNTYRRRKLAGLLDQSHTDVQQMLSTLAFAYERLADVVDISRDQHYNHYKNLLIQDPTLTYTQKRDLARQWLQTAKAIEQTRLAVLTHVKIIKTIHTGFDNLYEHRNALTSKALLSGVGVYSTALQQLREDLDQLKPVYGRL